MSEDDAFLAAVRTSPFEESTRLVYADWLQERDDPRAEFLRVESTLASLIRENRRDPILAARYLDLSLVLTEGWVNAVDRVPELLRPAVRDGDLYKLTPRRGETLMFLITGLFGLPEDASSLDHEQVRQAVLENRVVSLDVYRDGYGGGMVCLRRPDPTESAPDTDLVFSCVITDAILNCLDRNYWERAYEAFKPGELGH